MFKTDYWSKKADFKNRLLVYEKRLSKHKTTKRDIQKRLLLYEKRPSKQT